MLARLFGKTELTDAQKLEMISSVRGTLFCQAEAIHGKCLTKQEMLEEGSLSDATLRRFCVAREWEEAQIVEMLQAHLKWRKETLPMERTPAIERVLESGRIRVLRKGKTPIMVTDFLWGEFLLDENITAEDIIAAQICLTEEVLAEADAASAEDEPAQYIAVTTGGPPPVPFIKQIAPIFEGNYPERCCSGIIYPIPRWLSYVAWAILKLVPERTQKKFVLLSEEAEFCEKTGLSPDELPEDLKGGIEGQKVRRAEAMTDEKRLAQMPEGFKDAITNADQNVEVLLSQAACQLQPVSGSCNM